MCCLSLCVLYSSLLVEEGERREEVSQALAEGYLLTVSGAVVQVGWGSTRLAFTFTPNSSITSESQWRSIRGTAWNLNVRLRVDKVVGSFEGKFLVKAKNYAVMEITSFRDMLREQVHPRMKNSGATFVGGALADRVIMNLPPAQRISVYENGNYETIQDNIVAFSSKVPTSTRSP